MIQRILVMILLALIYSCTKYEYVIEEPVNPVIGIPPDAFEITVEEITNTQVKLTWEESKDSKGNQVKYEIAINDSVIAYDLATRSYVLTKLLPDTRYSVSVSALDSHRNSTSVTTEFKTMKSFLDKVLSFEDYLGISIFTKVIETRDGGVLIGGGVKENRWDDYYKQYLLKIDEDYNVQWYYFLTTDFFIIDIIELDDDACIVVRNNSILRVDKNGKEIWRYTHSKENTYILCSAVDNFGDVIFAGFRFHDRKLKYFISKLSADGIEQWWKEGGTSLENRPADIIIEPDGNLLIFGIAEYTGKTEYIGSIETSYWLLRCDGSGNFIEEKYFINKYKGSDIAVSIASTSDGHYLLMGTAAGSMFGYSGFMPRFTKIDKDGNVIWDIYPNLGSGGMMPSFTDYSKIDDERFLILTEDDRGIAISVLNLSEGGEIEKHIKLYGYPKSIFTRYNKDENYDVITNYGNILMFNREGYIGK